MAEDKQAGDLYVDIQSSSQGASKSLNTIIKKLEKLQTALKGVDTTNLSKMTQELNNASGARVGKSRGSTSRSSGGAFGFLNIARWGATIYMARRLGRVVADIAQAGADYTETLNLWETAMGTNVNLATEFVNKMNEAYGISEKTLMNAQATFKNMLGGLGNISDQMAYALSEGITQMAVDYASLYNQTFEQAFVKFQSALAGQVRPIRSVSGFDITENTIFQLYQQLGGTKTMRQLNRTEKQLLSILAIFQQMTATGAVGDLNKTMESFANQSRVMAESWQQVLSYSGVLLTHMIEQSGLLTYVNATLIFIGDTLKAVAETTGAIKHFADPFQAVTDGALTADEAVEQLNGKLLDFDKFRALNESNDTNALGLDEKLLQAFANFDSILASADMEARKLAESFKEMSGLFGADGVLNIEKWNDLVNVIKDFGKVLIILSTGVAISNLIANFKKLSVAGLEFKNVLLYGAIFAIWKAIEMFKDGDYWGGIFATTIGVVLVGAFILLNKQGISGAITGLGKFASQILITNTLALGSAGGGIFALSMAFVGLGSAILGAFAIITNWSDMNTWQKIIGIVGVATTAILGLAIAFGAFHSAWSLGLASAGIVAGIAMIVSSIATIKKEAETPVNFFANGGLPDKGTMFVAGEAGAEIVYNTPSGQSGVANIKQIEQAMYNALTRASNTNGGTTVVEIDGQRVFTVVKEKAKSNGYAFSKV